MTGGDGGLIGTPSINHTVRIIVKDLFLEGVIELQSTMARGESRHKDVGLGAFDGIVLDTGIDASKMSSVQRRRVLISRAASVMRLNKWAGSLTVTVVGLLIRSPNLPQKLFSISLAVALRPGFLAMLAMSSLVPGSEEYSLVSARGSDTNWATLPILV